MTVQFGATTYEVVEGERHRGRERGPRAHGGHSHHAYAPERGGIPRRLHRADERDLQHGADVGPSPSRRPRTTWTTAAACCSPSAGRGEPTTTTRWWRVRRSPWPSTLSADPERTVVIDPPITHTPQGNTTSDDEVPVTQFGATTYRGERERGPRAHGGHFTHTPRSGAESPVTTPCRRA